MNNENTRAVRALANYLCKGNCEVVANGVPCLEREDKRELTKAEKHQGWQRRPFYAYDSERLCTSCRAYWHVEQAAQALERGDRIRAEIKAEEELKSRS